MSIQKALLVKDVGKPLVLVHGHPVPEPGPLQVQIKVTVAGLNPHDQRSRDTGLLIDDKLPAVLAKDVVGVVTRIGPDVQNFQVGDRVLSLGSGLAMDSSQSGLQQYALADVDNCAKVPEGMSDAEAATIPTNLSAVFVALHDVLKLPPPWNVGATQPRSLLVVGGGSNCGRLAVQLAHLAKIESIVVVGGDEKQLKNLGASHVIDRHLSEDDIVERVRSTAGDDLEYALDAVNFPQGLALAFRSLSKKRAGKVARLVPLGTVDETYGHELLDVLGMFHYRNALCVELWRRLTAYLEAGSIVPTPFSVREGLTEEVVNAALDEYRDGKNKLKPQIVF